MKVLITADIHIDNYTRNDPSPGYRLHQFDLLKDRLLEIVKSEGCSEIWIAGDLINKAVPDPKVLNYAKRFFSDLKSKVDDIKYIRGQHDIYGKTRMKDDDSSMLNLFPEVLTYMDHKVFERSGHKFAFQNYSRKPDLSWFDHADVFIGHVSIGFGQKIDESKFDLGFYGDIHKESNDGKLISIGNPLQYRISDQRYGSVIILDTVTLKWHRHQIKSSSWTPYSQLYTEEGLGWNESTSTWEVRKKSKASISTAKEVIELNSMDFNELLESEIAKNDLIDFHKKVKDGCKDYHPVDFNFTLKRVTLHNIKGIDDFTYNFDGNIILVGKNGSGKSSFMLGIFQLLTGSMDWDDLQRRLKNKKVGPAWVSGDIEYQGKLFTLIRGVEENHLLINGDEVAYKDKKEFNGLVARYLPFIKYYHSYCFMYWVRDLLRSENNDLKMKIVSKFNGLDIFDNLIRYANQLRDQSKESLKTYQKSVDRYKIMIEMDEKSIKGIELPEDFDPTLLTLIQDKMNVVASLVSTAVTRQKLDNYKKVFHDEFDGDYFSKLYDKSRDELESIRDWRTDFDNIKRDGKRLQEDLNIAMRNYEVLKSNPNKCPKCMQVINSESYAKHLKELKDEVDRIQKEYDELRDKYKSYKSLEDSKKTRWNELKSEIEDYTDILAQWVAYQDLLAAKADEITSENVIIAFDPSSSDAERVAIEYQTYMKNLSNYNRLQELSLDLIEITEKLEESRSLRDAEKSNLEMIDKYISLISKDGPIFLTILKNLMDKLSNETFKFSVKSEKVRGGVVNTVSVKFYKSEEDEWKSYRDCSQGEKSLCDTYFINKLLNGNGILMFDEYYSHVDDDYLPLITDMLNETDINNIIISTHSNNMTSLDADVLVFPIENERN